MLVLVGNLGKRRVWISKQGTRKHAGSRHQLHFGEAARTQSDVDFFFTAYENAINKFDAIHRLINDYSDEQLSLATSSSDVYEIIKSGKKLKLIANFGNGVDNIDLTTAKEKKLIVRS